jgi:hypothetical protein
MVVKASRGRVSGLTFNSLLLYLLKERSPLWYSNLKVRAVTQLKPRSVITVFRRTCTAASQFLALIPQSDQIHRHISQYRLPMRSLDFLIDLTLPVPNMALGSTQPLTELSTRNLPWDKGRLASEAGNLTAICERTV